MPIGPYRATGPVVPAGLHEPLMNPGFYRILPLAGGPQVRRGKFPIGPTSCLTAQRVPRYIIGLIYIGLIAPEGHPGGSNEVTRGGRVSRLPPLAIFMALLVPLQLREDVDKGHEGSLGSSQGRVGGPLREDPRASSCVLCVFFLLDWYTGRPV